MNDLREAVRDALIVLPIVLVLSLILIVTLTLGYEAAQLAQELMGR